MTMRSDGLGLPSPQQRKLREELADLCHQQWSGWMEYLFSTCIEENGLIIPTWAAERWKRQMNTAYKDLSEEEKDSDRREADRFIATLMEFKEST